MIQWLKCFLYGHNWVQKGYNRIYHTVWDNGEMIECGQKDHFLFICRKCTEIREHTCEYHYYDTSEDIPVFSHSTEYEQNEENDF